MKLQAPGPGERFAAKRQAKRSGSAPSGMRPPPPSPSLSVSEVLGSHEAFGCPFPTGLGRAGPGGCSVLEKDGVALRCPRSDWNLSSGVQCCWRFVPDLHSLARSAALVREPAKGVGSLGIANWSYDCLGVRVLGVAWVTGDADPDCLRWNKLS